MQQIPFALLGHGQHAKKTIIPAFAESRHAQLTAIYSQHLTSAEGTQSATRPIFNELSAILSDTNIRAVFIASANDQHFDLTRQALEAGKHVLCEKPAFLTAPEAATCVALAKQKNLLLAEAFMYRLHPQHQQVKELLSDNAIGKVRLINASFQYNLFHEDSPPLVSRLQRRGGGALNDVGCYLIDLGYFLLGDPPLSVSATSYIDEETNLDHITCVQILYPDAITLHGTCAMELSRANCYSIYGTAGAIHLDNAFRIPRNKKGRIILEVESGKKSHIDIESCNQTVSMIDHFAACISSGLINSEILGNGLNTVSVMSQVREAARISGRQIP